MQFVSLCKLIMQFVSLCKLIMQFVSLCKLKNKRTNTIFHIRKLMPNSVAKILQTPVHFKLIVNYYKMQMQRALW